MKKILLLCACAVMTPCLLSAQLSSKEAWKQAAKIEKNIKKTSFPDKRYVITDFGAKPDAPDVLCHDAINLAIVTCNQAGGGTVVVPAGTFYTGPITLKSNVNLHLEEGAVLKFDTNPELYEPAVLTRWEGLDCYNLHPLIYAYGETNIAITGKGVVDAQGSMEHWWPMCGAKKYNWKEGMIGQNCGGRARLLAWGESGEPIYKRVFSWKDGMRPQLVNLYRCNRVLVEDVTLKNSPFWTLHPLFCNNLIVRGVTFDNHGPNGDGCDPESCDGVLIENCVFNTGDDCIAIKSGRNRDGRTWNVPSQNIIVRNCKMLDGHGGVVVGSEISGGYKNLFVENCEMDSPNLDRVIRIKTSNCRGGVIENIYVRNIKVGQCREAVLRINLQYENKELCDRNFPPTVRNVLCENIVCTGGSDLGVYFVGLEGSDNVYNIQVDNCEFNNVKKASKDPQEGIFISGGVKDVRFNNLKINGQPVFSPVK